MRKRAERGALATTRARARPLRASTRQHETAPDKRRKTRTWADRSVLPTSLLSTSITSTPHSRVSQMAFTVALLLPGLLGLDEWPNASSRSPTTCPVLSRAISSGTFPPCGRATTDTSPRSTTYTLSSTEP